MSHSFTTESSGPRHFPKSPKSAGRRHYKITIVPHPELSGPVHIPNSKIRGPQNSFKITMSQTLPEFCSPRHLHYSPKYTHRDIPSHRISGPRHLPRGSKIRRPQINSQKTKFPDIRPARGPQTFQKSSDKKRGAPRTEGPGDAPLIIPTMAPSSSIPRLRPETGKPPLLSDHNTTHTLRGGRSNKSSRTRDESQRIAGQAYSRAYNTPFKSSRLQGIPVGHTVPFHSSATLRPASEPRRIQHPSHDPDTPEDASIVKSNHAADYISSIYPARLPA